jgi:hypothetical protein
MIYARTESVPVMTKIDQHTLQEADFLLLIYFKLINDTL